MSSEALPQWLTATLVSCGLLEPAAVASVVGQPLTGGVSSDVWMAVLPSGPVCVKRALPRLRVAAVWEAPVIRYASEAAWLARAQLVRGDAVPQLLGVDRATGALVLGWLDPHDHPLWKEQLLRGHIDLSVAAQLGERLGQFHAAMTAAADPSVKGEFDNLELFESLRLAPYFRSTALVHPELAPHLNALCSMFGTEASSVVHGDVSPKNVLVGPNGPVLLDAECACWGDPAFDVAFLLTHLLLKARHLPAHAPQFRECAQQAWSSYGEITGCGAALESRVAAWWPALVLARIDGSSPVEYLEAAVRDAARADAIQFVARQRASLAELDDLWRIRP